MRTVRFGVLLLVLLADGVLAQSRLSVLATDPAGGSLPLGVGLHVKAGYQSEQPVRVQARGLLGGQPVAGMSNAAPLWPAGEGEVLAWIAYRQDTRIDAVEVGLYDADWRPLARRQVPIRADWSAGAPALSVAPWVQTLAQQQSALVARQAAAAESADGLDWLGPLIALSPMLYLLLQIVLPLRWQGGWRTLALLPLALMGPALLFSLFALVAGSNLWPIWMVLLAPLLALYLALLMVARFVRRRLALRA